MEQPTVVCHVSVVTVDFQATFKDVLVCDVVLMALISAPLPESNTSFLLLLFISLSQKRDKGTWVLLHVAGIFCNIVIGYHNWTNMKYRICSRGENAESAHLTLTNLIFIAHPYSISNFFSDFYIKI